MSRPYDRHSTINTGNNTDAYFYQHQQPQHSPQQHQHQHQHQQHQAAPPQQPHYDIYPPQQYAPQQPQPQQQQQPQNNFFYGEAPSLQSPALPKKNYPRYNFNKSEGRRRLKASIEALKEATQQLEAARQNLQQAEALQATRQQEHVHVSHQVVDELLESERPRPWNKVYFQLKAFQERHGPNGLLSVRASTAKKKLDKQKQKKKKNTATSGAPAAVNEEATNNDEATADADKGTSINNNDEDEIDAEEIGMLGRWAAGQRNHRKKDKLEDWKIVALDRLGFVWDAREAAWHETYQELKQFHDQQGHIRVLEKHNPSLNRWLRFQRDNYRDFQNNGFVEKRDDGVFGMNQERCDLLEALGMDWRDHDERWIVCFRKLKELYEAQGHLRTLPMTGKYATKLRDFAVKQRQAYKVYMEKGGRDCKEISSERVLLLEYLEFPWSTEEEGEDVPFSPNNIGDHQSNEEWMADYQKVKKFFKKHQHLRYEEGMDDSDEARRIRAWDRTQRQQYKACSKKSSSSSPTNTNAHPLTPERLELLKSLGCFFEAEEKTARKRASSAGGANPRKRGRPRKLQKEKPSGETETVANTQGTTTAEEVIAQVPIILQQPIRAQQVTGTTTSNTKQAANIMVPAAVQPLE